MNLAIIQLGVLVLEAISTHLERHMAPLLLKSGACAYHNGVDGWIWFYFVALSSSKHCQNHRSS